VFHCHVHKMASLEAKSHSVEGGAPPALSERAATPNAASGAVAEVRHRVVAFT
jgi:hypothetical protein